MKSIEIVCESCKGTGLYSGKAERNGYAMICHTCEGTGKRTFEYEPFIKRKEKSDIRRVFKMSCGFAHTPDDFRTEDGTLIKFSDGGCTYEEFLEGKEPKPVKDLYCPYLWTNQSMQDKDDKNYKLYKNKCQLNIQMGGRISECKCWRDKNKCWKEFKEN